MVGVGVLGAEQQKSFPHDLQILVEETEESSLLEPMALMKLMKQNVGRWRSHQQHQQARTLGQQATVLMSSTPFCFFSAIRNLNKSI